MDEKNYRDTVEEVVRAPYLHIATVPGKNIRQKLAIAFNNWLKIPSDKLNIISECTEILHNSSLIIDDIEDNSKLRRGVPVAHSIYGIPSTINSANYMYFASLEKALTLNHSGVPIIFTQQVLELHRGQAMDIYWRDNFKCPSEEDYKLMVIKKTGGLFGLAVGLMQLFSENQNNMKPLLDNLGLFFQIRDDYANLCIQQYLDNKGFAEDLTEGKFSFPIVHALTTSNIYNSKVMSILKQRTEDVDVKKYCVKLIEECGSFEHTINVIIRKQITELGDNPVLMELMNELCKIFKNVVKS